MWYGRAAAEPTTRTTAITPTTGKLLLEGDEFFLKVGVRRRKHLNSKNAGVPSAPYCYGGNGNTRRHLDDAKKGVKAFELFGGDRHSDHGKGREGRQHPGQVGGTAGAGDDDLEAAVMGVGAVVGHVGRSAMGADDAEFVRNTELFAHFGGFTHDGKVGVAAHDDTDDGRCGCRAHDASGEGCCEMRFIIPRTL